VCVLKGTKKKSHNNNKAGSGDVFFVCGVWSVLAMGIATGGSKAVRQSRTTEVGWNRCLMALQKWNAVIPTSVNFVTGGASPPMTDK
jgi:hypothetical protein